MQTAVMDLAVTLQRSRNGDGGAFAGLVREHQAMVYSIAWNFLHNRTAAEDLAQDVFLHLHRNLAAIQSPRHLTHWLRKVAIHRCIDQVRQKKVARLTALEAVPEPRAETLYRDPFLSALLRRLVAGLPPRPRMIVVLRYQEDLEPAEIAELLEIPVGTVKSTLHRALALLRGKMERAGKDGSQ
jgi:RNA polymerase sigma-70 factor (ECF subfamily)